MTDDLVKRLRDSAVHSYLGRSVIEEAADRILALTAERDEAINQLDSAIHSQIVLEKRTDAVMKDRRLILEERDRTFALMLARAEAAEADAARLKEELDYLKGDLRVAQVSCMAYFTEEARLREALTKLARFDDIHGSRVLDGIGSYAEFDDPEGVKIAREALKGYSHE